MAYTSVAVENDRYCRGMKRLADALPIFASRMWEGRYPPGSPSHKHIPYAFKAYALMSIASAYDRIMWLDSSIVPIRSLDPIWEHASKYGVWISGNQDWETGKWWNNAQWTADSAYPDLFSIETEAARIVNREIPHVSAGAIAIDLSRPKGAEFLREYFRLASETQAFVGPARNTPETPCGPPSTLGHRHDQTAASVIAWRLGIPLTEPPKFLAYKGRETEETILLVDGDY